MSNARYFREMIEQLSSDLSSEEELNETLHLGHLQQLADTLPDEVPLLRPSRVGTLELPSDIPEKYDDVSCRTFSDMRAILAAFDRVFSGSNRDRLEELDSFQYVYVTLRYFVNHHASNNALFTPPEFTLPAGTKLFRDLGEFRSTSSFDIDPEKPGFPKNFIWDATVITPATGVLWQVVRGTFPPFGGGIENDITPANLVSSGYLEGKMGLFSVDFKKVAQKASISKGTLQRPNTPDFYLRVIPVITTTSGYSLVGQPSNIIGVYYWSDKPPLNIKIYQPPPPPPSPPQLLEVMIDFDCLQCNDTSDDFSNDEPYLVPTGFSNKKGSWQPYYLIPEFHDVEGTGGSRCPVLITPWGPNGTWADVAHDEIIGFHVALCEQNSSDTENVRKVWSALGSVGVGFIAGILTEDPSGAKLGFELGKKVGDIVGDILAAIDPDAFLGEKTETFSYTWLKESFEEAEDAALKAVHEGMVGAWKPWLHPQHQEKYTYGRKIKFTGGDAEYILHYSVHIKNPKYIGPYHYY